jgi:TonB family protein
MRRLLVVALVLAACSKSEPPPAEPAIDTRAPIGVEYVRGAELEIHAKPDAASPVVTKYLASEAVSILSRQGEWVEVRTASGSGWAKASELASGSEITAGAGGDSTAPRFTVPPEPVSQPGASGDIVLEADVSSNGEVFGVRVIRNTTGSDGLAARNVAALEKAKFAPIIKHGQRLPFTYEHRVHY